MTVFKEMKLEFLKMRFLDPEPFKNLLPSLGAFSSKRLINNLFYLIIFIGNDFLMQPLSKRAN